MLVRNLGRDQLNFVRFTIFSSHLDPNLPCSRCDMELGRCGATELVQAFQKFHILYTAAHVQREECFSLATHLRCEL